MMRCFLACFRAASKRRKHYKPVNAIPSKEQSLGATEALPPTEPKKQEKATKPTTESKAEVEKQLNCDAKKRVTFDLSVGANGESYTKEVSSLVENNEEKKEETAELEPIVHSTSPSKVASFNHRYQNCRYSVDDYEDVDLRASDLDEDNSRGDTQKGLQEESSESLFSLSLDSRKHGLDAEIGEKEVSSAMPVSNYTDKEVKSTGSCRNARDRSQYVHSVLNPIENLTQWKEVQERPVPPPLKHQEKENTSLEQAMMNINIPVSEEPSFKLSSPKLKPKSSALKPPEHDIGVDTSLSSWLIESETTPRSNPSNSSVGNSTPGVANSPTKSREDRPILGAWTVEELKQFSASSSPRRLRSQMPDETPIIGTVGSYWIHTGQDSDLDSSCRGMPTTPRQDTDTTEDQMVNFKPVSFEARMEGALGVGITEACECP